MYYEVYIDSLFLLNFTMNLYLLLLINKSLNCTATRIRLFAGAFLGGLGYCLMFFLPFGGAVAKTLFTAVFVNGGILLWVYRPDSIKAAFKILETMIGCSFLMGGGFLLLTNHVKPFREHAMSVTGMLAFGGVFAVAFSWYMERKKREGSRLCKAILQGSNGRRMTVQGIVDTGNSLREPISRKPVSVLEKEVFDGLYEEGNEPEGFRAIPYRSVGCERGIMKGYQIPEMTIEQGGIKKVCRNVYVAVSEKEISSTKSYQMLIHPELLEK